MFIQSMDNLFKELEVSPETNGQAASSERRVITRGSGMKNGGINSIQILSRYEEFQMRGAKKDEVMF